MLQGTVQFLTWLRLKGAWGRPSAAGGTGRRLPGQLRRPSGRGLGASDLAASEVC